MKTEKKKYRYTKKDYKKAIKEAYNTIDRTWMHASFDSFLDNFREIAVLGFNNPEYVKGNKDDLGDKWTDWDDMLTITDLLHNLYTIYSYKKERNDHSKV